MKLYIYLILVVFISFDTLCSLYEIYQQPLQGDIIPLVLPDNRNAPILKDPFGIKALNSRVYHPNINRFFSTVSLYAYLRSAPFFLQNFVDPVESLYLSSTIFKFIVYLGFIFLITRIVIGKTTSWKDWILGIFIITPFMQIGGFLNNIELVGSSIVYQFFYGFPFLLLLLWSLPIFDAIRENKPHSYKFIEVLLLAALAIFCSFSSALMPGVILIGGGLFMAQYLLNNKEYFLGRKKLVSLASGVKIQLSLLLFFMILSLYSFYLGSFNSESISKFSILERYQKLWIGFVKYCLEKPSLLIIWFTIVLNYFLLKRFNILVWKKSFGKMVLPILIFTVVYILLLPLGGYREYRTYIIRGDMLIPTTILVFFLISLSSFTLFKNLKGKALRNYSIYFTFLVVIFSHYDYGSFPSGKQCESASLYKILKTDKEIVHLEENCSIMAWNTPYYPEKYKNHAKLWQYWNLTDHEVLIRMPKK